MSFGIQINMKFDDLFKYTGEIGSFQVLIFGILCYGAMFGADTMFQNFIGGSTMEHWCEIPELNAFPFDQQKYIGIPQDDEGDYVSCKMYDMDYGSYSDEELWNWDRSVMVSNSTPTQDCDSWMYDRTLYTDTLRSEFDLVCDKSGLVPLPSSMYYAGLLLGAYITGELSDRLGRKPTLYICYLIKFIAGVCLVVSPSFWFYLLFYFIIGFASAGAYMTGFIIVTEICGPKWRSKLGMGYHMAYSLGYVMYSGVAAVVREWRYMMLILYLPIGLFLLSYWIVPEAPRWTLRKGRIEEAEKILLYICRVNKKPEPGNMKDMLQDIYEEEKKLTAQRAKQKSCLDLYKSPTVRLWSIAINLHWFTNNIMYLALSLSTSALAGNVFVNTAIMGFVEFPAIVIGLLGMDWYRIGRRYTCSFALTLAGISSFIMVPLLLTESAEGVTIMSFIGKAFVTMSFDCVYTFSSEVFPTEIRNTGMGMASLCARIGGVLAPYMGVPLANVWAPLPSIIFGILATVVGLFLLVVPETLGQPLCQTLEEVEKLGQRNGTRKAQDGKDKSEPPGNMLYENQGFHHDASTIEETKL